MLPDSLPLIPAQLVRTSAPQSTAGGSSAHAAATFQAQVISQSQTPAGYVTEVRAEQQMLKLISQLPLPQGTQLTLQSSNGTPPVLNVTAVQLPGSAPASQPLPASVAQLLAARIPLLAEQALAPRPATTEQPLYNATAQSMKAPAAAATVSQPALSANARSLIAASLNTLLSGQMSASVTMPQAPSQSPPSQSPPINTSAGNSSLPASADIGMAIKMQSPAPASAPGIATALPTTTTSSATIPTAVVRILQQWLEQLPDQTQLSTASGVRQSLANSGLNYEQRLFALAEQIRAGTPQPSARPEPRPADSQPAKPLINATDGTDTRQQRGPSETLSNLFTSLWQQATTTLPAKEQGTAPHSLKEALQQAAARLNSAVASTEQPHQALLSGLLGKDNKAVLAKAIMQWHTLLQPPEAAAVKEIPLNLRLSEMPEALRQLHSALARVENEQIQRLQQGPDQPVTVPLLFRDQNQLREVPLTLQQDNETATDKQKKKRISWQLRLHFDLQRLGPLDIELDIALPRLSATFWSEQSHTLSELTSALQPLKSSLQSLGVEVGELKTRRGELPLAQRNQISQRLIDTHS